MPQPNASEMQGMDLILSLVEKASENPWGFVKNVKRDAAKRPGKMKFQVIMS